MSIFKKKRSVLGQIIWWATGVPVMLVAVPLCIVYKAVMTTGNLYKESFSALRKGAKEL